MKSHRRDSCRRARTRRAALVIVSCGAALALAGCEPPTDDPIDDVPPECRDDQIIWDEVTDSTDEPVRLGLIKLLEQHHADNSQVTTVIGAVFADMSMNTSESQGAVQLSGTCVGLSGVPVVSARHCEYTATTCQGNEDCAEGVDCVKFDRLEVAGVRVTGLAEGDMDMEASGVGAFRPPTGAVPDVLFGEDNIDIHLTPASGPHAFVSTEGSLKDLPPPRLVDLTEPDISGASPLGREDLLFRWKAGDNPDELVFIDVVAKHVSWDSASDTRNVSVSCVAFDDGCQMVWKQAIDWMIAPDPGFMLGDEIEVIVSRRSKLTADLSAQVEATELTANLGIELRGKMTP